jgi:hypothetical protein
MDTQVPFSTVLAIFEEHGWELVRIEAPYRIFEKPGSNALPYWVEVHDKKVDKRYVDKIKAFLEREERS